MAGGVGAGSGDAFGVRPQVGVAGDCSGLFVCRRPAPVVGGYPGGEAGEPPAARAAGGGSWWRSSPVLRFAFGEVPGGDGDEGLGEGRVSPGVVWR